MFVHPSALHFTLSNLGLFFFFYIIFFKFGIGTDIDEEWFWIVNGEILLTLDRVMALG